MTKKGSEGLDIIFSMYGTPSRSFVKIWAPLPQKCSVLSEYSHKMNFEMTLKMTFEITFKMTFMMTFKMTFKTGLQKTGFFVKCLAGQLKLVKTSFYWSKLAEILESKFTWKSSNTLQYCNQEHDLN